MVQNAVAQRRERAKERVMISLRSGLTAAVSHISAGFAAGALLTLAGIMPAAQAATIALFNTGVDAGGVSRSDGSTPDLITR
jgi:hypothetical protein